MMSILPETAAVILPSFFVVLISILMPPEKQIFFRAEKNVVQVHLPPEGNAPNRIKSYHKTTYFSIQQSCFLAKRL